jgi:hypothetical protein
MKAIVIFLSFFISFISLSFSSFSQVNDSTEANITLYDLLGEPIPDYYFSYDEKLFDENRNDTLVAHYIDEIFRTPDVVSEDYKLIKEDNNLFFINTDNLLVIENQNGSKRIFIFLKFISESNYGGFITRQFFTEDDGCVYLRYYTLEDGTRKIGGIEILNDNLTEKIVFH